MEILERLHLMWLLLTNIVPLKEPLIGKDIFVIIAFLRHLKHLNLPRFYVSWSEKLLHKYRLLFLHHGKLVWEGMTHDFTTSDNKFVQQVSRISISLPRLMQKKTTFLLKKLFPVRYALQFTIC